MVPMASQSSWQFEAPEVRNADCGTGASAQQTIQHRPMRDMTSKPLPTRRQIRRGIPAYRKSKLQRIANNDFAILRRGTDAIRRCRVDNARRQALRCGVDQHIEIVCDVDVGLLKDAGQRDDEGGEVGGVGAHGADLVGFLRVDVFGCGEGPGGDAAGHGDVVVDVEFEEVEEGVVDKVDCAVDVWDVCQYCTTSMELWRRG